MLLTCSFSCLLLGMHFAYCYVPASSIGKWKMETGVKHVFLIFSFFLYTVPISIFLNMKSHIYMAILV